MRISSLVSGLFIAVSLSACAEDKQATLDRFQWKNRIILTHPTNEDSWTTQQKMVQKLNADVTDRNLIIIRLDTKSDHFSKSQGERLIKQYKLTKGNHILIGKDGGVKGKQTGQLDLQKWFELIDTMPMRQAEMKAN